MSSYFSYVIYEIHDFVICLKNKLIEIKFMKQQHNKRGKKTKYLYYKTRDNIKHEREYDYTPQ